MKSVESAYEYDRYATPEERRGQSVATLRNERSSCIAARQPPSRPSGKLAVPLTHQGSKWTSFVCTYKYDVFPHLSQAQLLIHGVDVVLHCTAGLQLGSLAAGAVLARSLSRKSVHRSQSPGGASVKVISPPRTRRSSVLSNPYMTGNEGIPPTPQSAFHEKNFRGSECHFDGGAGIHHENSYDRGDGRDKEYDPINGTFNFRLLGTLVWYMLNH